MFDHEDPHFSTVTASLAMYSQYLFNLHQNTARINVQQRMLLTAYEECPTTTSGELERLRHENAVLHSCALSPLEQDRELLVAHRHLSEAEHGWNYTHMLLDITHEEVDIRTHGIIHLECTMETPDAELEERVETTANLE
jgi:hypothetical protein